MRKINFFAFLLCGLVSAQTTFTLVKDILPGVQNSTPSNFAIYNGKLYFSASSTVDGVSIGAELWESDGTEAGTKLVSDIVPGSSSSSPNGLYNFNDKLYFSGTMSINGTNTSGVLMSYDVANGVQLVSSVAKFSSNHTKLGNTLYFKASNTNVTPNTSRLFYLNSAGEAVIADDNLNVINIGLGANKILANAQVTTAANPLLTQLFGFDGTSTALIKNVNPNTSSYPQYFMYSPALGKTLFNANGGNGGEPWITDGTETGTVLLKDINVSNGTAGSNPNNFTEYNGKVYFSASDGLTSGIEPWVTDGTEQGTKMLKDIIPGTSGSFPEKFVVVKDKLYFFATSASNVKQIWETDGTDAGTKMLAPIASGSSLLAYNDKLYVVARISSTDTIGTELYKVNLPEESLSVSEKNEKLGVYPNPSDGDFFVSTIKSGFYELSDVSGRVVSKSNFFDGKISTKVPAGIYFLKVQSDDSKTKVVSKIIIR
ncbi:T9SS type A sorting domain-containing protein [Epilithonimonas sp.]|uniref:T9SS type A sorting domain-containing protein n=1 Tax=Epilithonimonas sp. TaxID=2894511 RepID=UPI0028A0260A|nr:T9SS type A sorting domain-containing protein [Epilithonimonas sp.]